MTCINRNTVFILAHVAIVLLLLINNNGVSSQVYFRSGSPRVTLANGGVISGALSNSRDGGPFTSFTGIPYATFPERFAESQVITEASWEGVKEMVKPGPVCVQNEGGKTAGEEVDCLNLNVYVPMHTNSTGKRGYPVMVWIHGGGFMSGGGYLYGPKYFMDEDVILVTLNYRLSVFGFLSTGDEVIPGNNGLKDQVNALRWVQANIKSFGGDPSRVTIFGESAGGVSVHYLLLSPSTKGLFQRAISQSGTALGVFSCYRDSKEVAVKLATYLKCPTSASTSEEITSEEILKCLKDLPADELIKAQGEFAQGWPPSFQSFFFGPTAEPETTATPFLTQFSCSIVANKSHPLVEVPWMVGATEDEGAAALAGLILSNEALTKELDTEWKKIAPKAMAYDHLGLSTEEMDMISEKIRTFYFGTKAISKETRENLTNLYSDQLILHATFRAAVDTAARGKRNTVYLYQFAQKPPVSFFGMALGLKDESLEKVGHGDELVFQFDFETIPPMKDIIKPDSPDEEFSKNFVKLWASFAAAGEPKHTWGAATYRKWKEITKKELDGVYPFRWFRIDENPTSIENPYKERIQFWDGLWRDHFAPVVTPTPSKTATAEGKTEL